MQQNVIKINIPNLSGITFIDHHMTEKTRLIYLQYGSISLSNCSFANKNYLLVNIFGDNVAIHFTVG